MSLISIRLPRPEGQTSGERPGQEQDNPLPAHHEARFGAPAQDRAPPPAYSAFRASVKRYYIKASFDRAAGTADEAASQPPSPIITRDPSIVEWISDEILPHEGDVRRWLRRSSLGAVEEDDVIQEAYCRLAGVQDVAQIRSGRAYFFTVARNIVLEHMRRARIVQIETLAEMDGLNVVDYDPSPERSAGSRQELERVRRLIDALPEKCRLIFTMRKIEGRSQRQIAQAMGVSENVVEKQVARGLRLVLDALARNAEAASVRRSQWSFDEPKGKQRRD
jgi:RNA polymerase sigma factor (sigma-70 family)